jgi:hypothetical protein
VLYVERNVNTLKCLETLNANFTFCLKSRIAILLSELQLFVYLFNKLVVEFGFCLQLLVITQLNNSN